MRALVGVILSLRVKLGHHGPVIKRLNVLIAVGLGFMVLLVHCFRRSVLVLDHDNLGGFVTDGHNMLLTNWAVPYAGDARTMVVFPQTVANEACREMFLSACQRVPSLEVLDSRDSESTHVLELVSRKMARSLRLPNRGSRLIVRPTSDGAEFESRWRDLNGYFLNWIEEKLDRQRFISDVGVPADQPYVCFNVRDRAYGNRNHPRFGHESLMQDFRNPPLTNYVPAIQLLIDLGYTVVRMGHTVERPFPLKHPNFIDYACGSQRSDLGDLVLYANCDFAFQGSGSGIDTLATLFGRPLVLTDFVPLISILHAASSSALRVVTPCLLTEAGTGTFLSMKHMGELGFTSSNDYAAAGVQVLYNTPEEIVDTMNEFLGRLQRAQSLSPSAVSLQRQVVDDLVSTHASNQTSGYPLASQVGDNILLSEFFLIKYFPSLFADDRSNLQIPDSIEASRRLLGTDESPHKRL